MSGYEETMDKMASSQGKVCRSRSKTGLTMPPTVGIYILLKRIENTEPSQELPLSIRFVMSYFL